ncbi:uncharacterized protein FTOL_13715 [Fusarium torulosum]|uniref:Uncharacterized protein n=1 Tax=Fusarium torulosum TaxID=33205 RepID=A0AAE8MPB0_9HYPO|nr:uncharacterized protein FTOL_13715 [Fusarium torulosum]
MARVTWRLFHSDSPAGWRPPSWHTWAATIRRTASALLLLRAQRRAKDGEQILHKMILARYLKLDDPPVIHKVYLDQNPEARTLNLGHILGSSVAAHSEILVHVISAASMAITIIKITASSLPWGVLIPAWFMISEWLAIQALIALIHGLELGEDDIEEIASLAREIGKDLFSSHSAGSMLYPGFNPVKLLLAVCLAIMRVFFSERWPPVHWYAAFAIEVLSLFMDPAFFMFVVAMCCTPIFLLSSIIVFFPFVFMPNFRETLALFPLKMCWLCWDCFALHFLVLTPRMASPLDKFAGREEQEIGAELWLTQPIDVVLNILITIPTLALGLDIYNPTQTMKPQWLDWLG